MSASTIALRAGADQVSGARERVGRPATRRDPRTCDADRRRVAAGEPRDSDRVRHRLRPDRLRLHCEPGAAGRQSHGPAEYEASITGKWLAMLKEIAPRLARAALVANPKTTAYDYFLRAAEAMAPSLAIELVPSPVENAADIERAIGSFARVPNGGLVLPPDGTTIVHRDLIIALAARHRLPAVYAFRFFVAAGGLMSYGHGSQSTIFRQAASYVDRILRGANPADLPVQAPTKYETVLNLKTAKALGLTVPPGLLVRRRRGDRMSTDFCCVCSRPLMALLGPREDV